MIDESDEQEINTLSFLFCGKIAVRCQMVVVCFGVTLGQDPSSTDTQTPPSKSRGLLFKEAEI